MQATTTTRLAQDVAAMVQAANNLDTQDLAVVLGGGLDKVQVAQVNDGGHDALHRAPLVGGEAKLLEALLDDAVPFDVVLQSGRIKESGHVATTGSVHLLLCR